MTVTDERSQKHEQNQQIPRAKPQGLSNGNTKRTAATVIRRNQMSHRKVTTPSDVNESCPITTESTQLSTNWHRTGPPKIREHSVPVGCCQAASCAIYNGVLRGATGARKTKNREHSVPVGCCQAASWAIYNRALGTARLGPLKATPRGPKGPLKVG